MLTWDESASSTTRGASVNKVIMVPPIQRNIMVVPFNRDKTLKTRKACMNRLLDDAWKVLFP
jgi:hypothetical protein